MATTNNPFCKNHKGKIQKTLVVKQYGKKTILTGYPNRTHIKYTGSQQNRQSDFAQAVAFAQSILSDPEKRARYSKTLPKGKRLYNAAIQEYFNPQAAPFSNVKPPVKKRGKIAEETLLIKRYKGKEVLSARPDMSRVKQSTKQKAEQNRFAQAVLYAQSVVADPQQKAEWQAKLKKGKRVYNAALKAFMDGLAR